MKIIQDIKILNKKSNPVSTVEEAKEIIKTLEEVLSLHDGIGLSAIQIGIPKRIAVLRIRDVFVPIINPEVIKAFDPFDFIGEGCLSFPGIFVKSKRYEGFIIKNNVIQGDSFREETQYFHYDDECKDINNPDNYETIAIQHEMDHMEGKTLMDFSLGQVSGTIKRDKEKVGRNDDCPCGSGKKYKKCCINK